MLIYFTFARCRKRPRDTWHVALARKQLSIRHFRNEKGISAVMYPAIVSGIVTGDAVVSYWSIFFPVPSNNPRSLCESQLSPVSSLFLKWRIEGGCEGKSESAIWRGGRNKGRGRRIPVNTHAKEFKTMILLLKTVNLQASWRADCAVNVNCPL